jgi:N6-L-threonylcarbamoyladenine synthase
VNLHKTGPKIQTLSSVVKSQIALHSKMGGVVPEAAARAHVKYIRPVVEQALASAFPSIPLRDDRRKVVYKDILEKINYIAVTKGPGLIPSLLVGVEFAKALSFASGKPLIPVNHMAGHLYSPFGNAKGALWQPKSTFGIFPMISLIVSGGHTILVLMKDAKHYRVLGQTIDDAAGEAFDKVAKMLRLPYPGGPEVSRMAEKGNPVAINFPRPMLNQKNYDFSFSGLKTAVLYYMRAKELELSAKEPNLSPKRLALSANICASFEQAVVDVLVTKTLRAVKEFKARSISLSGGVAANRLLRNSLNLKSKILNLKFMVPPINLCTDNAEMIGIAAGFMLSKGFKPVSYKKVKADSNLQL